MNSEVQKLIEQIKFPVTVMPIFNAGYQAQAVVLDAGENVICEADTLQMGDLIATAINNLQPKEENKRDKSRLYECEDCGWCDKNPSIRRLEDVCPRCGSNKLDERAPANYEPQPKRFTMQEFEKGLMLAGIIEPRNEQEAAEKKRLEDWEAKQNTPKE